MRNGEQARQEMVKAVNGQILRDGVEVRRRWAQYFEQVLNVADVIEANINVVGNWRMPVLGDLNERATSLERGRVDDLSFFDYLSPFCFLLIEFHSSFSIS